MTELKNYLKPLTDKNAQLVTRYIKNWADSAKLQVCSSHLTLCGLTVNRSEMPNFSYTHPLAHIIKDDQNVSNRQRKKQNIQTKGNDFFRTEIQRKRTFARMDC